MLKITWCKLCSLVSVEEKNSLTGELVHDDGEIENEGKKVTNTKSALHSEAAC